METRKVLSIIFSIIFLGAFAFVLIWGITNFNKVQEAMSGTQIYDAEDLDKAYNDGYNTALTNKAEYDELINGYRDNITSLNDTISQLNSDKTNLQNLNKDCEMQISNLTTIKTQNEETINNLKKTVSANETTIATLNTEITGLNSQITDLNEEKNVYINTINSKNTVIENLQKQIDVLQEDCVEYNNTINSLNNRISTLNAEIEKLNENKEDYNHEISNLHNEIAQLETQKINLQNNIKDKEIEINSLSSEILTLNNEINSLNIELNNKNVEMGLLNNQITNLQSLVTQLQTTNELNLSTIDSLNSQITALNTQVSDLTLQIQNNGNSVSALNNRIKELESSIEYYEQYIAGLESQDTAVATFEFNGAVYSIQVVNKNSTISVTTPESTEYVIFNGWTVNGEVVDLSTYTITSNTMFIADVTKRYDVKFVVDDTTINTNIVTENEYAITPENPSKEGYEFDGWTLGNNVVDVATNPITAHTTYVAKFTKLHTVTFMYENEVLDTQNIRNGNKAAAPQVDNTTYKIFNGWKYNYSLVNVSSFNITNDTTFVADITYKYDVTFVSDGTTIDSQIITNKEYPTLPENPTKDGYEFIGWTLNGNDIVNPLTLSITKNITYIAKFEKLHTVTFVYENETIATQVVKNGNVANIVNVDNTSYKVFNGWKVNNVSVNIQTYKITKDTTFVADIIYKYDVTFVTDGNAYNSQIVTKNAYASLPTNPVKSGYEFDGWTIDNVIIDVSSYPITETTIFTAKFTRVYTVTFTYEDEIISSQTVRNGSKATLPNVANTTHKVFNGWLLNDKITDVSNYIVSSNLNFVASITYKYDVNFMVDGTNVKSDLVIKGQFASAPANPSKSGYEFLGWSVNGVDIINPSSYAITQKTTFMALFQAFVTVTFAYEDNTINTQKILPNTYASNVNVDSTDKKVFKGWSLDGTNIVNVESTPITSDTRFIAVIDYFYNVKLVVDNKTVYDQLQAKNSNINYSADMVKDYHIFNGWYFNNSQVNLANIKVSQDMTINASYTYRPGAYIDGSLWQDWNTLLSNGYVTVSGTKLTAIKSNIYGAVLAVSDNITEIGDGTNWLINSNVLTGIYLPTSVTRLNRWALSCVDMSSFKVPSHIKFIDSWVFNYTIANIDFSEFTGELNYEALRNATSLRNVYLPSTIGKISCENKVMFGRGSYVESPRVRIFTDCSENNIPSTWIGGWNKDYDGVLEVVYNYPYEDFDYKTIIVDSSIDVSGTIKLSDYGLTVEDLQDVEIIICELGYYGTNMSGQTNEPAFTIPFTETYTYVFKDGSKSYDFVFNMSVVGDEFNINATTTMGGVFYGGNHKVRFTIDSFIIRTGK